MATAISGLSRTMVWTRSRSFKVGIGSSSMGGFSFSAVGWRRGSGSGTAAVSRRRALRAGRRFRHRAPQHPQGPQRKERQAHGAAPLAEQRSHGVQRRRVDLGRRLLEADVRADRDLLRIGIGGIDRNRAGDDVLDGLLGLVLDLFDRLAGPPISTVPGPPLPARAPSRSSPRESGPRR